MENTLEKNKSLNLKKTIMLLVVFLLTTYIFAADDPSTPSTKIDGISTIQDVFATIYGFFTSAAVRVIAIAGVIFTGIKIITNKGNTEMMKQLIPILIACIIIGSASWFVNKFMGTAIKDTSTLGGSSWY